VPGALAALIRNASYPGHQELLKPSRSAFTGCVLHWALNGEPEEPYMYAPAEARALHESTKITGTAIFHTALQ
jgi:hypothetical protein